VMPYVSTVPDKWVINVYKWSFIID
jgi:hypothetical protein